MLLITQDADGSVPFFWGTDSDGHLVLSDDAEIVKTGCGKSFAPFPKGNNNAFYQIFFFFWVSVRTMWLISLFLFVYLRLLLLDPWWLEQL